MHHVPYEIALASAVLKADRIASQDMDLGARICREEMEAQNYEITTYDAANAVYGIEP